MYPAVRTNMKYANKGNIKAQAKRAKEARRAKAKAQAEAKAQKK